jgi:hypothetical protein
MSETVKTESKFRFGTGMEDWKLKRQIGYKQLKVMVELTKAVRREDDVLICGNLSFPKSTKHCECKCNFPKIPSTPAVQTEVMVQILLCDSCIALPYALYTTSTEDTDEEQVVRPESSGLSGNSAKSLGEAAEEEKISESQLAISDEDTPDPLTVEHFPPFSDLVPDMAPVLSRVSKRMKATPVTTPVIISDPDTRTLIIKLPVDVDVKDAHRALGAIAEYTSKRFTRILGAQIDRESPYTIAADYEKVGKALEQVFNCLEHTTAQPFRELLRMNGERNQRHRAERGASPTRPPLTTDEEMEATAPLREFSGAAMNQPPQMARSQVP